MQGKMSNNLCEALRKMQIRSKRWMLPRRSANLWLEMVKSRLCEIESVLETSRRRSNSKQRYGLQAEGNHTILSGMMKAGYPIANASGYKGDKPSTSVGGARSEKMIGQIKGNLNKTYHPELGCSGNLNPTVTVHLVNLGTSCSGLRTGLAATEVEHEGREIRSSQRYGRHTTWRRNLASCNVPKEIGRSYR